LITLLSSLWILAACSGMQSDSSGQRIFVVGDSYTTGLKDDPTDPDVWPALTWKHMRADGYDISPSVAGEGGAGYAHPGHLGSVFGEKAQGIQPSESLIVFFGSANDMSVAPEALRAAVRDTLTKARLTAPKARLVVFGPAWPHPEVPPEVGRVRDIVREGAAAIGATFIDPLEQRWLWDDPALIGPDGIHPNRDGQHYLAEKIRPVLEAELTRP